MKRTLNEALETASKMKQELPSVVQPDRLAIDIVVLGDALNIAYKALQMIGDPMAEVPKEIVRNSKALGDYYEELARETIAVMHGKYERK